MEIRWLEDFMALARTRHFSRAAEQQHVSQPTFSRRIRLLEDAMGTTLVNRQTLPLSLTPAGEAFVALCERVTRDVRETRDRIDTMEAEASARISVGTTQGLLSHFYREWVEQAGIENRLQLNLKAVNWVGEQFLDALDSGDCDLVLCYWHRDLSWGYRLSREKYQWLNLAEELLVPVTVGDDSGQARFVLPGTSAQPVPLIAYHPRGFLHSAIEAHLNRAQVPANLLPLIENTQSVSIKDLVKQGFGMGWLPQRLASRSEQYGDLMRAGDDHWNVGVDIRLIRLREPRTDELLTLWNTLESQHA